MDTKRPRVEIHLKTSPEFDLRDPGNLLEVAEALREYAHQMERAAIGEVYVVPLGGMTDPN